jgi:hypothetical protein
MERRCTICQAIKPMSVFGAHPSQCKLCRNRRHLERYPHQEDTLYVMGCPDLDPDGIRLGFSIGRTCNSTRRLIDHQRGLPFKMVYHQVYLGAGPVERAVHRRLSAYRNCDGLGREWFRGLALAEVFQAIEVEIENARTIGLLQAPPRGDPRSAPDSPESIDLTTDESPS